MGAWEITKKDLRLLVRDKRTLVILLALPLIFITILGISTGQLMGWRDENQLLKIALVREDTGPMSAEVVAALARREGLQVRPVRTREAAVRMIEEREATAAVIIGPKFGAIVEELTLGDILDPGEGALSEGLESLDMHLVHKASFASAGAIVDELVLASTLRTLVPHVARKNKLAARFMDRARESRIAESAQGDQPAPHTAATRTPAGRASAQTSVYQMLVPAYTVLFAFFLVNIMARSFLSERELGTLRRLRVAPVRPVAVLVGKTLPFFLISLAQCSLLFLAGRLMFGMSWGGEPWLLIPVIACTSLAATTLGLLTATLVRTDSQVSAYSNFLVITMAAISGCFMPREWLPRVMQQISLATPHAWALSAFDQILAQDQTNRAIVGESCLALLAFAALFFALGFWRFRTLE